MTLASRSFFSYRVLGRKVQGIRDKEDRTGELGGLPEAISMPSKLINKYNISYTISRGEMGPSQKKVIQ